MSRADDLRAELARLDEDERREAEAERQRKQHNEALLTSDEFRRQEDEHFLREHATNWNAAPRDSYGQKIAVKSDVDRYCRIRGVQGLALPMSRWAAFQYGDDNPQTAHYRSLAGIGGNQ